jgi:hypothetical protein
MLTRLVLLVVSLVVAATASGNPLIAIWKSDLDFALPEMEKLATLTFKQREVLFTPDLFGQAAAIYGASEIEHRLAQESARLSYRMVATGSDFVESEYDDEQVARPVRKRLLLEGGLIHVPVEETRFHEAFPAAPAP